MPQPGQGRAQLAESDVVDLRIKRMSRRAADAKDLGESPTRAPARSISGWCVCTVSGCGDAGTRGSDAARRAPAEDPGVGEATNGA